MEKISVAKMTYEEALVVGLMSVAVLRAFEHRGWALYSLGTGGPILFQEQAQVDEFIQFGREKLMMDMNIRYLVLPLVDLDADPRAIMQCMAEIAQQVRGPCYFDMVREADGGIVCAGKYLIDSIMLTDSGLELTVDIGDKDFRQGNTIVIPVGQAPDVVRKQVMLALRGPKRKKPKDPTENA